MAKGSTAEDAASSQRTAVFLSYSRRDNEFVSTILPRLGQLGLEVWRDTEDIAPAVEWRDEISEGIANAEAVIVVVSPDSMASDEVGKEISGAEEWGKLIVPVLHRELDGVPAHPDVAKRNFVFWRTDDEAESALQKIDVALKVDPDWAKLHTRVNKGAVQWRDNDHDRSRLLRGAELEEAELAIGVSRPPEQPQATELMHQYVAESRRVESRRQRMLVITSLVVAAVSITLAIVALVFRQEAATQRDEAVRQRDTATAAALAAESENRFESEPDLAALLALEAFRTKDTVDAQGSLLDVVDRPTTFIERANVHEAPILAVAEHPTLPLAATADALGGVVVWDRDDEGGAFTPREAVVDAGAPVVAMAFALDGAELVVSTLGDDGGELVRVDVSADTATAVTDPVPATIFGFSSDLAFGAGVSEAPDGRVTLSVHDVDAPDDFFFVDVDADYSEWEASLDTHVPPVVFSPDGSQVALAVGNEIHVWTVSFPPVPPERYVTNELDIFDVERLVLDVYSLAFVDDDRLAFGTEEGNIHILQVGGSGGETTPEADSDPFAGATTPEGSFLEAIAAQDEPLVGEAFFPSSTSRVWALDVVEVELDGIAETVLASAHNNGEVKVWFVDGLDGFETVSLRGHDEEVRAVLLSELGLVLSGSFDGDVITSSLDPLAAIGEGYVDPAIGTASHDGDVLDVAYAGPDVVASLDDADVLKLWDATNLELVDDPIGGVTSIDAEGDIVVIGDGSGEIIRIDLTADDDGEVFEEVHDAGVIALALSPDGRTVASADEETAIWIWDATGQRTAIAALPSDIEVETLGFADAQQLWVGGANGADVATAVLVDATTGGVVAQILHNGDETGHSVTSVAASPDGQTLVTGGSDRRIFVWDATDLEAEPAELRGHLDNVTSIVFLDDTTIIAGDDDGRILVWDLVAGRVVGDLTGPADAVTALALHPQNEAIVAGSEDDTVWSWDLRNDQWVEQACALAGRNMTETEWEQLQLDDDPVRHCPDFGPDEWPVAEYPTRGVDQE